MLDLYGFPFAVFFTFFHFSLFESYIYIVVDFSDHGPSVSLQCIYFFFFFTILLLASSVDWFKLYPFLVLSRSGSLKHSPLSGPPSTS